MGSVEAFSVRPQAAASTRGTAASFVRHPFLPSLSPPSHSAHGPRPSTLRAVTADLDTVALVAGQENLGFAIVALGEAIWSVAEAPSVSHALRVLGPAVAAAVVLVALAGPLIASGDAGSVSLGLEIATGTSVLLGGSYLARLLAPYSPSAKELAFAGLLVAVAGFFSFSQNLVVDGFVTLPSLPSIPFPQLPLGLGENIDTDRY